MDLHPLGGRLNEWGGRIGGLLIVGVELIILREVIARSVFDAPSLWPTSR